MIYYVNLFKNVKLLFINNYSYTTDLYFIISQALKMSQLPKSFDPYLLTDDLFKILKESPLTVQLVPMRAEEIITSIIEK